MDTKAKTNTSTVDQGKRDFLKKSAYSAYAAPALVSLVVSTNAAADYAGYLTCLQSLPDGIDPDVWQASCASKHLP